MYHDEKLFLQPQAAVRMTGVPTINAVSTAQGLAGTLNLFKISEDSMHACLHYNLLAIVCSQD